MYEYNNSNNMNTTRAYGSITAVRTLVFKWHNGDYGILVNISSIPW